jgi:hypothetical protein
MASLLAACTVAALPRLARLGVPLGVPHFGRSSPCPAVRMQLVWGKGPDVEQRAASGAPSLMELSVSYGWCLSDVELAEMQSYQVHLSLDAKPAVAKGDTESITEMLAGRESGEVLLPNTFTRGAARPPCYIHLRACDSIAGAPSSSSRCHIRRACECSCFPFTLPHPIPSVYPCAAGVAHKRNGRLYDRRGARAAAVGAGGVLRVG